MARQVYVWDKFVRVFHWSLVMFFAISYLSGDEIEWLHVYSGYAIILLISLRLIWGFMGTPYARFSNFVKSPVTIMRYLKTMFAGNPKRYLGHNPAGGAMVVALLLTLLATTFSGLKLYAVEEGKGPLAKTYSIGVAPLATADDNHENKKRRDGDEDEEEFWEECHEIAVNLMLLLIIVHVSGVFYASYQHRESLIKAMVTGKKDE